MKIGLIGDHITDIYIYGKMNRFSPESPIPIFDITHEETKAGGASNVNNNLQALGVHCLYWYDGVDYSIKKRYVCDNHIMFRCDEDKWSKCDPLTVEFPEDCKYVILSDYNKGVLRNSQALVHKLKQQGKIVIIDPKRNLLNYEGADIVKMNESEYGRFSMIDGGYQETRRFYNIGTLVITRGCKGPIIVTSKGIVELEGIEKEVCDVTGAGDVFVAAMTYYLAKGDSIEKACAKANQLASMSVCHFGTYMLTQDDIRAVEKKTVFTNGCFDVLHRGHIEYLKQSKQLGDRLVVGINSDASVKRLKGLCRPINTEEDRKFVLESLDCVDEVIIFDEDTPYDLIKRLQPDIITKGGDYTVETVVGNDLAEVVIIPTVEGYSTTNILENINENR